MPVKTSMEKVNLSLRYRKDQLNDTITKGYEFHYSTAIEKENLPAIVTVFNAKDILVESPIYKLKN